MYASGRLARSSTLFEEAFNRWNEHNAPRLGAALAFYTLCSLAPLLAICATLVTAVFGPNVAKTEIVAQVRSSIGDNSANVVAALIAVRRYPAGVLSGATVLLALFFAASAVFTELRSALNEMWSARTPTCRSGFITRVVRQRVFAFAMVVAAGLFLIFSTAASMLISIMGQLMGRYLPASPHALETLNVAISIWILAILFALMFRLVPDVRLPWRPIFVGAVLTTILFTLGRGVLDLYLAAANVGSMYGAAGSLVVIVIWVYYSAQILLFGAEFTKVYADSC